MEPTPYIDEQTGQRFYNVQQAAEIVQGVSKGTMWKWAKKGVTGFGFKLDIQREPLIHEPRGFRQNAKTHRETRMLIPEEKVLALREIFQAVGRDRPARFTDCERDALRAAIRRRQTGLTTLQHVS